MNIKGDEEAQSLFQPLESLLEMNRRMFHLNEGVQSSDRSTYMKGFQSPDLPRRMFHLYEGVRSSDRSTYMKGF